MVRRLNHNHYLVFCLVKWNGHCQILKKMLKNYAGATVSPSNVDTRYTLQFTLGSGSDMRRMQVHVLEICLFCWWLNNPMPHCRYVQHGLKMFTLRLAKSSNDTHMRQQPVMTSSELVSIPLAPLVLKSAHLTILFGIFPRNSRMSTTCNQVSNKYIICHHFNIYTILFSSGKWIRKCKYSKHHMYWIKTSH